MKRTVASAVLALGAIGAGLVLVLSLRDAAEVFVLRAERSDFPRSVAFSMALSGYLTVALVRRLFVRDLRLSVDRQRVCEGFALAWGLVRRSLLPRMLPTR